MEVFEACGGRERKMWTIFCEDAVKVGVDGVGSTGGLLIDPGKYEGQKNGLETTVAVDRVS